MPKGQEAVLSIDKPRAEMVGDDLSMLPQDRAQCEMTLRGYIRRATFDGARLTGFQFKDLEPNRVRVNMMGTYGRQGPYEKPIVRRVEAQNWDELQKKVQELLTVA